MPLSIRSAVPLALAALLAGCNNYEPAKETLSQPAACKAVSDHLKADQIEDRFGPPSKKEDFFGDTILTYRREDVEWRFQVSGNVGTFRALRQPKGKVEEILPCKM